MTYSLAMDKPWLSVSQIVNMNVGFLGIQFSFGLQQANMSPIYQSSAPRARTCPICGWPGRSRACWCSH